MNKFEYDFLKGKWDGPKGAAYNQVFEFCQKAGWLIGRSFVDPDQLVLSHKGTVAVYDYEAKHFGPKTADEGLAVCKAILGQAVDSFKYDPADTDFQRGYQAALEEVMKTVQELIKNGKEG